MRLIGDLLDRLLLQDVLVEVRFFNVKELLAAAARTALEDLG
jgi:hypothetical protein